MLKLIRVVLHLFMLSMEKAASLFNRMVNFFVFQSATVKDL